MYILFSKISLGLFYHGCSVKNQTAKPCKKKKKETIFAYLKASPILELPLFLSLLNTL